MEFAEFAAVFNAYAEQRDTDYKDRWQRMRLLACITIQPHLGKRHKVTPEKLLPFPWESKPTRKKKKEADNMTLEERRARMAELVKKLGDEII